MSAKVSLVRCSGYDPALVQEKVKQAIDLLGGITAFIKPQSRVLVKPNLLMAKEPEFGIVTHPEVVRAVIKVLKQINCRIFVGDGPSVWGSQAENVDEVYLRSGIKNLCEEESVELVKFDKKRWRSNFALTTWLDNCDHLVNIAKLKTHTLTLLTCAVKNLFGLVWQTHKTELHKNYFQAKQFAKVLVDIYQEVKPSLTVVDAIFAMEGDGPATAGILRPENLLLAGQDCVALDSVAAKIIGVRPEQVLYIKEAAQRGLGESDLSKIEIVGEKLENVLNRPFILPSTSSDKKIPQFIVKLAKGLIKYYPYVLRYNCIKCGACIKVCPNNVISMAKKGIVFNYKNCISCFCCQEVCPASAIKIKKSLFARVIGL